MRDASVIICVHNRLQYTRRCLELLLAERPPALRELIVVDNGSSDGTADYLRRLAASEPLLKVLSPGENLGFVDGNNLGASQASGEYLVFLNNDTEPTPGWLEALIATAERDASVGAVGAKLVYPDGRLQEAGAIVFADGSGWNYGRGEDPDDPRFRFVREVDYCSAACLLVRAERFRAVGGFDRRYAPAYYEDTDLCFALRAAGSRVLYQPRAVVVHHEGATAGTDLSSGVKRYQERNRHVFAAKWSEELARQYPAHPALARRASDRSPGRRILVVDALMPAYDRASGSRRLFELLRLMRGQGHAVTFIARCGTGADPYREELEQLGVEVYAGDPARLIHEGARPFDLPRLLAETSYDLAWISFYYVAEQYLPLIRSFSPRTRVVVDSVDVHFLREEREADLLGHAFRRSRVQLTRRRELDMYRQADAVVAVTEADARVIAGELPDATIHIVPNIHELPPPGPGFAEREGLLFVGNFAHPPNVDAARFFVEEVLPHVRTELGDVPVTIVGQNPPSDLARPGVEVTGWLPDLEPLLRSRRVSVAPLRYGAGMKGKISETLAYGLPVVTTPVGIEGMEGAPALVADGAEVLARQIARLYRDEGLWRDLAERGRAWVGRRVSPQVVSPLLDRLVETECGRAIARDLTSIIVLCHNELPLTRACLESIERCTAEPYELIVVDNGSSDGTADYLRAYAKERPNVAVVVNCANRGFAAGNNQGLALARGGTICLLNNDTVVTPGWLGRLRAALDRHPDTGLVGPMSNRASGPQLVAPVPYTTAEELSAFAEEWAAAHAGETEIVARLVGFCVLVRREVVERIGGLDERFGLGTFEDDDFTLRAVAEGFSSRVARDCFVHHEGSRTFAAARIDYRQQFVRNWRLFKEKWGIPEETPVGGDYEISGETLRRAPRFQALPCLGASHDLDSTGRVWQESAACGVLGQAVDAVLHGGVDELRSAFAEAASWDDPHRRYQMRRHLAEVVLSSRGPTWMPLFAVAAEALVGALEEEPREPVLLNYAGVFLYELGEFGAAEVLFRAARRLDPQLPHLDENLAAARRLKGRRSQAVPRPLAARAAALARRAKQVAARARPASGLTLSLCMIVRDEEAMLPGCLEPVHRFVDEIVVVDTGSSDRTVEIAERYGAKVIHVPWTGSFADARNVSLDHASGDWILYLDADEHVLAEDAPKLRELLGRTWREGFHLVETNYTGGDETGPAVTHLALRIFRNRPQYRFQGRIHEQKTANMPTYLPERFETAPIRILHYGYLKSRISERDKSRRNLELLEREDAEAPSPFTAFNLGSEYSRLGDRARAREYFERAWSELGPAWSTVGYASILVSRLASARRATGDIAAARAAIEEGLAVFPDHTDLVFELALCAWEEGDLAEAERLVRRCLEMGDAPAQYVATVGSGSYLALCLLAELRREQGDVAQAEELYRRSLAEYPNYLVPVLALATCMLKRGASPGEVAREIPSDRPVAAMLAGTAFLEAGQAEEAERWFREALARQPANGVARVGLVEALLSQRRYEEAASEAAQAVNGTGVDAIAASAELFARATLGDAAGLERALERASSAGVPDHDLRFYRAWRRLLAGAEPPRSLPSACVPTVLTVLEALLRVQEVEVFATCLRLYERIDVDPRERREALARVYLRRGFIDSAAEEWLAVAEEAPDAASLVGLAQVAYARGLSEEALDLVEGALQLDPDHPEATRMRTALLERAAIAA